MQSLWDVYLTYQSSFTHYLLFSLEVDIKLSGLKKKINDFYNLLRKTVNIYKQFKK